MAQRGAADGYFDEAGYDAVVVGSGYGGSVAACRLVMAGIKVCLIEKGKRWGAKDFPTSNYQMWSKGRLESDTLGFSFGPKDALFQVNFPSPMIDGRFMLLYTVVNEYSQDEDWG
ncbi:hypothetical protein AAC387_Pa05g1060 [Persea americana]